MQVYGDRDRDLRTGAKSCQWVRGGSAGQTIFRGGISRKELRGTVHLGG